MMSIAQVFSFAEPGLVNQLSDFQTGFTPWDFDYSDLSSMILLEPVVKSPCSDESETGSVRTKTSSGSNDCFLDVPSPQSEELNSENTRIRLNVTTFCDKNRKKLNRPVMEVTDERKRKRMESNRESAKRSRTRKQMHIENLRDEVNQLGLENHELKNRLRIVLYHFGQIIKENNRLLSEQEILRRRFLEMRRILVLKQIQNQQKWR